MIEQLVLAAASGAAGALVLLLAALRLRVGQQGALTVATAWTRSATPKAAATLSMLSAAAVACAAGAIPQDAANALAVAMEGMQPPDAVSLLVAAPGAPEGTSAAALPESMDQAGQDNARRQKALASLREFAERIEHKRQAITNDGNGVAAAQALPDVDTMMERLRARLDAEPSDLKGWMTLGWAYSNTGRYAEAIAAYEAALKLDSGNSEIKSALDDVKSKTVATSAVE